MNEWIFFEKDYLWRNGNMNENIKDIWIESEHTAPMIGSPVVDENSDVIVTLQDGTKYIASLFTYENIKTLTEKNQSTGENLHGKYFWASDMVLVDRIDRKSIEQLIDHLIESNEFDHLFNLLD